MRTESQSIRSRTDGTTRSVVRIAIAAELCSVLRRPEKSTPKAVGHFLSIPQRTSKGVPGKLTFRCCKGFATSGFDRPV